MNPTSLTFENIYNSLFVESDLIRTFLTAKCFRDIDESSHLSTVIRGLCEWTISSLENVMTSTHDYPPLLLGALLCRFLQDIHVRLPEWQQQAKDSIEDLHFHQKFQHPKALFQEYLFQFLDHTLLSDAEGSFTFH